MRGTYKVTMRLWKDSEYETPVYWFPAEPGAEVVTACSSFRARRVWEDGYPPGGVGELEQDSYPYHGNGNPIGYDGQHFCGSTAALLGGGIAGRDDGIVTDEFGDAPCCHTPHTTLPLCLTMSPDFPDSLDLGLIGAGKFAVLIGTGKVPPGVVFADPAGWALLFDQEYAHGADTMRLVAWTRQTDGSEGVVTRANFGNLGFAMSVFYWDPPVSQVEDWGVADGFLAPFPQIPTVSNGEDRCRLSVLGFVAGGVATRPGPPDVLGCVARYDPLTWHMESAARLVDAAGAVSGALWTTPGVWISCGASIMVGP